MACTATLCGFTPLLLVILPSILLPKPAPSYRYSPWRCGSHPATRPLVSPYPNALCRQRSIWHPPHSKPALSNHHHLRRAADHQATRSLSKWSLYARGRWRVYFPWSHPRLHLLWARNQRLGIVWHTRLQGTTKHRSRTKANDILIA